MTDSSSASGNTIEFAAAVDRLMSADRLRHTLGEAASESVRRFTAEAVLQRREASSPSCNVDDLIVAVIRPKR